MFRKFRWLAESTSTREIYSLKNLAHDIDRDTAAISKRVRNEDDSGYVNGQKASE